MSDAFDLARALALEADRLSEASELWEDADGSVTFTAGFRGRDFVVTVEPAVDDQE